MVSRVHTGKFVSNSRTFQGLHRDSPSVFKDYNFMKNTKRHYNSSFENLDEKMNH